MGEQTSHKIEHLNGKIIKWKLTCHWYFNVPIYQNKGKTGIPDVGKSIPVV